MDERQPVIISAVRTAIGTFGGALKDVPAADRGRTVIREVLVRAGVRQETTVFTINKVCASGMKAVALAAQAIRTGDAEAIVAGGMESMSNVAYALPKARWGSRMDIRGQGA